MGRKSNGSLTSGEERVELCDLNICWLSDRSLYHRLLLGFVEAVLVAIATFLCSLSLLKESIHAAFNGHGSESPLHRRFLEFQYREE